MRRTVVIVVILSIDILFWRCDVTCAAVISTTIRACCCCLFVACNTMDIYVYVFHQFVDAQYNYGVLLDELGRYAA